MNREIIREAIMENLSQYRLRAVKKAFKILTDPEKIEFGEQAVALCMGKGWPDAGITFAMLLPEPSKTRCLESLLAYSLGNTYLSEATKAAKMLGRVLSVDEINAIMLLCIRKQLPGMARIAAQLLPKEDRKLALKII